jgi:uncharacterized repeat protein (TIGR03987 family)
MTPLLLRAVTCMVLALCCYTFAVFSGRRHGLHARQLVVFGIGLFFDWQGTLLMNSIALAYGKPPELHNLSGIVSLAGMAFHFLLALAATCLRRADRVNRTFHRVSLTIYCLWLLAFVSGAVAGMLKLAG